MINTYTPNPLPLTFRPPCWFVIRPDGTYWIVFQGDIDRLKRRIKARRMGTGGTDGGAA